MNTFRLFFWPRLYSFFPHGTESGSLNALAIVFVSIVLEAIPFMLVGSLIGGFIETFVSRERMATLLPRKGRLTVCVAAGAGIIFPVCECAVVLVVRRLIAEDCCAPDALPMAIALDLDQETAFANDQWVQVEGIFDFRQIDGNAVPLVSKPRIKAVEAPAVPYLF